MARPFTIKRNDTSRSLKYYPRANPQSNFTGATVVFNMRHAGAAKKIERAAATISSDSEGTYFQYNWVTGDTNTAGMFEGEFEVTLTGGAIETYPNEAWIDIKIPEDIA